MNSFRLFSICLFGVLTLLGGGCSFENPLTSSPSKDINSWLLGVWEHKDEKGQSYRATVVPQSGDRYWVNVQTLGKSRTQKKSYQFDAHISRVGRSNFLTLKCISSSGNPVPGNYSFAHYQVLDQNHVRIRIPAIEAEPSASSYELRKEVRAKLKDNSLYPDQGSDWTRTSEVHWSGDDLPQPFQPLRYPEEAAAKHDLKILTDIERREQRRLDGLE